MKIIGWIRIGDKAACGGTVAEGLATNTAYDRALTFRGARMQCPKLKCVVAGHLSTSMMANGREMVHHGHLTSGGCPLLSTLNDIAGVGVEPGAVPAAILSQSAERNWVPLEKGEATYDEQVHLVVTGSVALSGLPYYVETANGRTLSGRADAHGLLPRVETFGSEEYTVLWGDEALAKMNEASA